VLFVFGVCVRGYFKVSTPPEGANPRFSQVILAISQVLFDPKSQVFYFFGHFPGPIWPKSTQIPGFPRFSQVFPGFLRFSQVFPVWYGFIKKLCFSTKIEIYRQKLIFIDKNVNDQPVTQYKGCTTHSLIVNKINWWNIYGYWNFVKFHVVHLSASEKVLAHYSHATCNIFILFHLPYFHKFPLFC